MYAIVDIETTGGASTVSRITEVAIIVFDGSRIVNQYHSLVNPKCEIPRYITALTGIDNQMVSSAPSFEQIADEIHEIIGKNIFLAHNVNFDHSFLKAEFARAGKTFNKTRLCTIRLARKIFPGFASYSLGTVCRELGIHNPARHRALGDASATLELFTRMLTKDPDHISSAVKKGTGESILPPNVSREDYQALPTTCGVYYFLDAKGKVLYVGKANNLRQRVTSHFGAKSNSREKHQLINKIQRIRFTECGNELISLLLESDEIRRLWPPYNEAQKGPQTRFGLYEYEDRSGIRRLGVSKVRKYSSPVAVFPSSVEARNTLTFLAEDFGLCLKLCNLQTSKGPCDNHQNDNCSGYCVGEKDLMYNTKVEKALKIFKNDDSFILWDKGRIAGEYSIILVDSGIYKGFGYCVRIPVEISEAYKVIELREPGFFPIRAINSFLEKKSYLGFKKFSKKKKKAANYAASFEINSGLFAGL